MRNQTKAYAYALTTVLLWSTVASAFKLSLRHVDHFQLLLVACAVSILVLSVILVVQGRWRLVLSYSGRQYAQSLALGLLNPFLYYLILFKAYDLLPAQEAQPLNYTWALTLAFLSVPLLGQRLSVRDLLAGLVSYSGVVVIATRGDVSGLHFSDPLGVVLALGSTVIWALYWIYNTKDERDPVALACGSTSCSDFRSSSPPAGCFRICVSPARPDCWAPPTWGRSRWASPSSAG